MQADDCGASGTRLNPDAEGYACRVLLKHNLTASRKEREEDFLLASEHAFAADPFSCHSPAMIGRESMAPRQHNFNPSLRRDLSSDQATMERRRLM
jgi:hypothetical protein